MSYDPCREEKKEFQQEINDKIIRLHSSWSNIPQISYHEKNAQFLLQLFHVIDYDWWIKSNGYRLNLTSCSKNCEFVYGGRIIQHTYSCQAPKSAMACWSQHIALFFLRNKHIHTLRRGNEVLTAYWTMIAY